MQKSECRQTRSSKWCLKASHLGGLGSTFHGNILHKLFGLGLDMVGRVFGGLLDFLGLRQVLVVDGRQRRRMGGKHVLQDVVEAVGRFHAVLFEAI